MLLVQEYLKNHSFEDLAKTFGVYASFSKSGHKFSLNYDQIEAKESDPLAQECRGLILASENNGQSYLSMAKIVDGKFKYDDVIPGTTMILAYPMNRFFNYGQGAAADIDWSDPKLSILEKLDGCFDYDTLITCWDGSVLKIGEIVKKKLSPLLIGMDDSGKLCSTKITNWFDNGTKNNWLEVTTNEISNGKNRKFKITSNHSVLVNDTFIPIMNAHIGDSLSSFDDDICDWTLHFIQSSLLGDASLTKNGKNFRYEEAHKIEHADYSLQIKNWLGELYSNTSKRISGYGSNMINISSKPNLGISKLREQWYKDSIKILPNNLDWFDDFTIAKWYMDDGSLGHNDKQQDRALFATNNFSEQEVNRLSEKLTQMYGVKCTVYFSKGWCLRVNSGKNNEIDKMWKAISPYIISCMRYKLPKKYINDSFQCLNKHGKILKIKSNFKILNIKQIELTKNNKKQFPHGRHGYDLETECHSYIANNIIVHNSLTIVYYDKFINEWCVATRSVPEADIIIDGGTYTFRTLFEKALKDTNGMSFKDFTNNLSKEVTYCFELTTPYNRVVVYYKESRITLIAARHITSNIEMNLDNVITPGVPHVQTYSFTSVNDLLDWVSNQNPLEHEGVVVRDSQFRRLKMKNASYVAFNRARDILGTSERNCVELVLAGKEDDVIPALPQEIVDRIIYIKNGINTMIKDYDRAYKIFKYATDQINPGDKKTFAMMVNGYKGIWSSPMFSMFDNKCLNMREFIATNRKEGTWGNNFLDKILEITKKY